MILPLASPPWQRGVVDIGVDCKGVFWWQANKACYLKTTSNQGTNFIDTSGAARAEGSASDLRGNCNVITSYTSESMERKHMCWTLGADGKTLPLGMQCAAILMPDCSEGVSDDSPRSARSCSSSSVTRVMVDSGDGAFGFHRIASCCYLV